MQTDQAPPIAASTSNLSEHSPSSACRPAPLGLSPAQVEKTLQDAARKAEANAQRTAARPITAKFDAVLAEAGGDANRAKDIVKNAQRADWRETQRLVMASAFETPEEAEERHQRELRFHRDRYVAAAGVPKKHKDARIDSFDHLPADIREPYATAVAQLRLAVRTKGAIIALLGARGPGKTHMTCGLVLDHCRRLISARYGVTLRYFDAIKHEFRPGGDESAVERTYRDPHLLILDEIQVKGDTSWQANRLTDLIDYRHGEDKVTVIVGNVHPDGLVDLVAESIADRIQDGGGVIECAWPSLRGHPELGAPEPLEDSAMILTFDPASVRTGYDR